MSLLQEHYENRMVEMIVSGHRALVPVAHHAKIAKKETLVAKACQLQRGLDATTGIGNDIIREELEKTIGKIIRLNRRIPACVQFIKD
jgi:hypothetical protein